jgi:hypothetical protein
MPKSPSAPHTILPADTHCNAWIPQHQHYCHQRAGHRTPHPGQGRCWLHGGCASMARITHGRYSRLTRTRLATRQAQYAADPDHLNIRAELATSRALLVDFLERWHENHAALLAWHASWSVPTAVQSAEPADPGAQAPSPSPVHAKKPVKLLDIADAYKQVEAITRIVERIERLRMENAISRPELLRILSAMARAVERHVPDTKALEAIRRDWGEIRV